MSSKPTIALSRWADQGGANLVSPTSGERDLGFQAGTPASAGKVNWQLNQDYLWNQYLSDGDVALHNVTANTLELAGTLTCDVGAVIAGAVTIGGNASVGGTLAVTGASTLSGGVTVPTGQAVTLNGTTTLTAGGLVTANAGVTAAANQHVTVSGSGQFKHGTRTMPVLLSAPTAANTNADITLASTGFQAQILLPAGKRILAVRAILRDSATGPTKLQVALASNDPSVNNVVSAVATSSASTGSGSQQTIAVSATTTLAAGHTYYAQVVYNTGTAACHLYVLEVDYDEP